MRENKRRELGKELWALGKIPKIRKREKKELRIILLNDQKNYCFLLRNPSDLSLCNSPKLTFPEKIVFLVFPIGVKLCTIILCNNPCDRKMPKHFSCYLKGLFWILSFLSFLAFGISPKPHLCFPNSSLLDSIMFCHDKGPCQFPWFYPF